MRYPHKGSQAGPSLREGTPSDRTLATVLYVGGKGWEEG